MLERDIGVSRLRKSVDNTLRAQDLTPDGPRSHPSGEIHGRAEVAIVTNERGAMMQAGANDREILAVSDQFEERRQRILGCDRVRKYEKRAIAGD